MPHYTAGLPSSRRRAASMNRYGVLSEMFRRKMRVPADVEKTKRPASSARSLKTPRDRCCRRFPHSGHCRRETLKVVHTCNKWRSQKTYNQLIYREPLPDSRFVLKGTLASNLRDIWSIELSCANLLTLTSCIVFAFPDTGNKNVHPLKHRPFNFLIPKWDDLVVVFHHHSKPRFERAPVAPPTL